MHKADINLHLHTKHSDGKNTVADIVSMLAEAGVKYFAITDHDRIAGNKEVAQFKKEWQIHFNGIELTCCFDGELGFDSTYYCHILGLGFDYDLMEKEILKVRENKFKLNEELFNSLIADGYNLSEEKVRINGKIVDRRHIGWELIRTGYATTSNDAFREILNSKKYRHFSKNVPTIAQGINLIQETKGIAVWAHPYSYLRGGKNDLSQEQLWELGNTLVSYGIDAMEVYYQEYEIDRILFLEILANKLSLLKSIATDYHCQPNQIFFNQENVSPEATIIELLKKYI